MTAILASRGWAEDGLFYLPWAVSSMQAAMNRLSKPGADAGHASQFLAASLLYALQSAEKAQQLASASWADTRDILECRGAPCFIALCTVATDGEAV